MNISGAGIICKLLERQGVETVAGIPGGMVLPLYDALAASPIRHVLTRHEQGAGFVAQGMARVTGRAAVCIGTSGPGAANLITAIADARMDSVPIVVLTGQVPTAMLGTDAFQEMDMTGVSAPVSKHSILVRRTEDLLTAIPRAFEIAQSGRPGPVVVDIPKDVQSREIEVETWPAPWRPAPPRPITDDKIARLAEMIRKAERPVLLVGGGAIASGAGKLALDLSHRIEAPAASTLMGLGAIPAGDPLYLGMLGMHGARRANLALDEADLLIAIGARFGDRATGRVAEFCEHAAIVHIDIDPAEIDKIKPANLAIEGDAAQALSQLREMIGKQQRPEWLWRINELGREFPEPPADPNDSFNPLTLIETLGEMLDPETVIVTDVGQHQMWTAMRYPFQRPRTFLSSGGLGTMGFGLPTAIGAALASPGRRVVCVSGDGSILMNIQELATLAALGLDVTVALMNNRSLGLVRQQQELFYGERYHAVGLGTQTDFTAIARGFGVKACDLGRTENPRQALREALSDDGPNFVNIPVATEENALPMVPPGAANREAIDAVMV